MASLVMLSLTDIEHKNGTRFIKLNVFQFYELLLIWVFVFDVTVEVAVISTTVITLSAAEGFYTGMSQVMDFHS